MRRQSVSAHLTAKATACIFMATVIALPAFGQTGGNRHDRLRDYLGQRSGLRQPKSTPRHRNPTVLQRFRTINGEFNNLQRPNLGMAGTNLRRRAPAAYADGVSAPSGAGRLSAREISNLVCDQDSPIPNEYGLSSMLWQWGQFLDHDLDLTEPADPPEPFFIAVPSGDVFFDPFGTGAQQIMLFRSVYRERRIRNQINEITSWIDGSNVYGSDDETAMSLRSGRVGMMLEGPGGLLPLGEDGFFLAGDIRANEQNGLTAMHTLFVREHNRIARRIASRNRRLSDEQIYLRARKRVVSILQAITYNEYLPALLGPHGLDRYRGYRADVNPNIANVFSTASYRFGHSMLNSELLRLDNSGNPIAAGNIALRDAFFNPDEILTHGIDPLLKGLTVQTAQQVDSQIIDDVRNFLFGMPGSGGFDLASLNIQRGRDHGLPDLNTVRIAYGLRPHQTFADLTSDVELQLQLLEAYGDINDIDPWVGCLAEDHVFGATVGETAHRVLAKQFESLRDGDRFWYQRDLRGRALESIENTSLRDVIVRNTGVRGIPRNVFFVDE